MLILVHDAISINVDKLPPGQVAGYVTGIGIVPWTPAQQAAHPTMIRIAQSPDLSTDEGVDADILDVESGAAGNTIAATWFRNALASFETVARPGQRYPAIYTSASNVTPLVDALIADGIKSGPHLWLANWSLSDPQAASLLATSGGPFPIIGVQFQDPGPYDTSLFVSSWVQAVSGTHVPPKPGGPYPHTLVGHSLHEFAAARGASWQEIMDDTAAAYTDGDSRRIIPGMRVYTDNP